MKRLLSLLLICLLLAGCAAGTGDSDATLLTPETEPTTLPSEPWISQTGMPWDTEGALLELPLTIPDGLHYTSAMELDGDLLLWSVDEHLENQCSIELCLVELDNGTITAENTVSFTESVFPQILENRIYLCGSATGKVLMLDKNLQVVQEWKAEPCEGTWFMGMDDTLYGYDWNGSAYIIDLETGEEFPLLEENPYVSYLYLSGDMVNVEYYHPDTGIRSFAVVDLSTGDMIHLPAQKDFTSVSYRDGTWLCDEYYDGSVCYIWSGSDDMLRADIGNDTLQLLNGSTLLRIMEDGCRISLHDRYGTALSQCTITEMPYSYTCNTVIPSKLYGGYFLVIGDYSGSLRLLYWDASRSTKGEDIPFAPIPEPSDMEMQIRERTASIQQQYGINVLIGNDCQTSFYNFEADLVTDWDVVSTALDTLENALAVYPEDFFRQLRYDTIRRIDIHLVGTLYPYDTEEYVESYSAFVQEEYDHFLMAADIYSSWEETYYHEFSHIIDAYLLWDSLNREDAQYSEEGWEALNPSWFTEYSYDYSIEHPLEDYESFVDGYSTIKPTEDRARVMEYAMADYGFYTFNGNDVLMDKLEYYCRCIRDAFDTTGWPEVLPWEQYL